MLPLAERRIIAHCAAGFGPNFHLVRMPWSEQGPRMRSICIQTPPFSQARRSASVSVPAQELAQLDYDCLRYKPSELAAAAMLVAHAHVGDRRRVGALSATSGYSTAALKVRASAPDRRLALTASTARPMSGHDIRLKIAGKRTVDVCAARCVTRLSVLQANT